MHKAGPLTSARRPRAVALAGLLTIGTVVVAALAAGSPVASAQPAPTPTPLRLTLATPTPFRAVTTTAPATTSSTAPRAGELPTDVALPLLAGGAAFLGGGAYLLRRKPRA